MRKLLTSVATATILIASTGVIWKVEAATVTFVDRNESQFALESLLL